MNQYIYIQGILHIIPFVEGATWRTKATGLKGFQLEPPRVLVPFIFLSVLSAQCAQCPPRREDGARGLSARHYLYSCLSLLFFTENGRHYIPCQLLPNCQMQSNAKYFVEFRHVASIYVQVHCAVMCMKHKCIGGQSGSEISYLFLRVVNIASVLLKKLPYGPLCHLPTELMRKNPTPKTSYCFFWKICFARCDS